MNSNGIRGSHEWTFLGKPQENSVPLELYLYPTR